MNDEVYKYIVILISGTYNLVLLVWFIKRLSFRRKAVKTKGIIVEYMLSGRFPHPIIEFSTLEGQQLRMQGDVPRFGRKGKKITMYYDVHNPSKILYPLGVVGIMEWCTFIVMSFVFLLTRLEQIH